MTRNLRAVRIATTVVDPTDPRRSGAISAEDEA